MMALLFHHYRHLLLLLLLLLTLEPLVSEALRQTPATPLNEACCSALSPRITTAIALAFLASITTILWYIGICRRRNVSTDAANADGSAKQGLEKSMIDSFGIMLYSEVKELKLRNGPLDCAICLCEFEEADSLRLLPVCSHAFHPCCIDTWLLSHTTCPVCRASLIDGQLTIDVTGDVEENRPGTSGGEVGRNEWTEEERERFTLRLPETLRLEMVGRRLERSETMGPPATGAWKGRTTEGFIFLAGRKELAVKSDRYVDVPVGRASLSSPEHGGSAVALDGSPVVEAIEGGGNRC